VTDDDSITQLVVVVRDTTGKRRQQRERERSERYRRELYQTTLGETDDRETLQRRHVQSYLVLEDFELAVDGSVTPANIQLDASSQPVVPIEEPIRLGKGEVFDLDVRVAHEQYLPSAGDYQGQVAQLTAFMEVAKVNG